jgi:4-amino-4-deoxy-L-arabinose transferase-like glycosyltransferase
MLVSAFALIAILALVRVWQGGGRGNFWLAGGALGLGILAKGPVVLLAPAFVALLAPWWMGGSRPVQLPWRRWFGGCLQALGIAAAVPLVWLVPMAIEVGPGYVFNLVWGQTTGYVVTAFAHARPWWWYLPVLPLMLFPWTFWPEAWRAIWRAVKLGFDPGTRLCLAWSAPTIVAFSLFIGKQAHYLLPIFPALALLLARGLLAYSPSAVRFPLPAYVFGFLGFAWLMLPLLTHAKHPPEWSTELSLMITWSAAAVFFVLAFGVSRSYRRFSVQGRVNLLAGSTWLAVLVIGGGIFHATWPAYDVRPASEFIATLENSGAPVGMVAKSHGAYHFFGRLKTPIQRVEKDAAVHWAQTHSEGYLIVYYRAGQMPADGELSPVYQQLFRGDTMAIWRSEQVAQHPDMASAFK